jgi:hypothetical protein
MCKHPLYLFPRDDIALLDGIILVGGRVDQKCSVKKRGWEMSISSRWIISFLLLITSLLCYPGCKERSKPVTPGEVASKFVAEAFYGDSEVAYGLLCEANRNSITAAEFEELFHMQGGSKTNIEIMKESIQAGEAIVTIKIDGSEFIYFKLIDENGEWKLDIKDSIKLAQESPEEKYCGHYLRILYIAILRYTDDFGEAPKDIQSLVPKYIDKIPTCPGGGSYSIVEGKNGEPPYAVCSAGHSI